MTNDEPTEVDHDFVCNVYTAPAKPVLPEPEPSAPLSYHSETEVEVADKPTTNGSVFPPVVHETPTTPPVDSAAPEQQPAVPITNPSRPPQLSKRSGSPWPPTSKRLRRF